MMKYRKEMTAEMFLKVMEDKGEIKVKGMAITVYTDEDGEVSQMVSDYMKHFYKKGYSITYR